MYIMGMQLVQILVAFCRYGNTFIDVTNLHNIIIYTYCTVKVVHSVQFKIHLVCV